MAIWGFRSITHISELCMDLNYRIDQQRAGIDLVGGKDVRHVKGKNCYNNPVHILKVCAGGKSLCLYMPWVNGDRPSMCRRTLSKYTEQVSSLYTGRGAPQDASGLSCTLAAGRQ